MVRRICGQCHPICVACYRCIAYIVTEMLPPCMLLPYFGVVELFRDVHVIACVGELAINPQFIDDNYCTCFYIIVSQNSRLYMHGILLYCSSVFQSFLVLYSSFQSLNIDSDLTYFVMTGMQETILYCQANVCSSTKDKYGNYADAVSSSTKLKTWFTLGKQSEDLRHSDRK